jgi:hypothetical protein
MSSMATKRYRSADAANPRRGYRDHMLSKTTKHTFICMPHLWFEWTQILNPKPIHIHGRMEHNLVKYAKYYPCKSKEISRGSEFTKEIDYNKIDFSKHW